MWMDEPKKDEGQISATRAAFKRVESCRISLDRFVLAHFFLIFFVSFAIGIVFLHSTMTLFNWEMSENSVIDILQGFLYKASELGYEYRPPEDVRSTTVYKITLNTSNLSLST